MSQKTRRLFLSDLHLGTAHAWFKPSEHKANLLTFLRWAREQSDLKDLVLLGDVIDQWMYPMEEAAPSIESIAHDHREVLDALAACSATQGGPANILYIPGNHDQHVTQAEIDTLFGMGVARRITRYNAGLLYAEHGSRFTMFNAPDRLHDPQGYPLGFFITRMIATSKQPYKDLDALKGYVDDALEAVVTTQTLAAAVVEALKEHFHMGWDAQFTMPGGNSQRTLAEIRDKYAPLYTRWAEKFGHRYAIHSIQSEFGSLDWFADRECKKMGYRVMVMGHTHDEEVEADRRFTKDRVCVNAGEWCKKVPSFVEVDKQPERFVVKLWKVADGDLKVARTENVTA